jgi:hypothetical protein
MKSYSIFQYCFNTSTLVYRTLNSRSKYKCFQVYRQKEIKLSLPELCKVLLIISEILRGIVRAQYKIKFDCPPRLKTSRINYFPGIADRHPDTWSRSCQYICRAKDWGQANVKNRELPNGSNYVALQVKNVREL